MATKGSGREGSTKLQTQAYVEPNPRVKVVFPALLGEQLS